MARRWHPATYCDKSRYDFWSEKISGKGDVDLPETAEGFRKFIVIKITGKIGAAILIGFVSGQCHKTMIIDTNEKILESGFMFSMGMDRADCDFSVASNDGDMRIELIGYKNSKDPELQKLPMF